MAAESVIWDETFSAAEDLSSSQFYIVESTGTSNNLPTAGLCTGSTGVTHCFGVLQNKPDAAGKEAQVRIMGLSRVVANGGSTTVALGSLLTSSTDGKAIVATSQNHRIIGRAITGTTGTATVIEAHLFPIAVAAAT